MTDLAGETHLFKAVTWTDLARMLDQLAEEEQMREAGLQHTEVTDLMQGQLFIQTPGLALRMARVLELRFNNPGAVAYLRSGIPQGSHAATPEAGAFLLGLRLVDASTGACRFVRYPRVKRAPGWQENVRQVLVELLNDVRSDRVSERNYPIVDTLTDLLTLGADDIDGAPTPAPQYHPAGAARPDAAAPGSFPDPWDVLDDVQSASALSIQWDEIKPAGISLPVWMSGIASLALILSILLAR